MMRGGTDHQMGAPRNTMSASATGASVSASAGRAALSAISSVLREPLSCQFRSAAL